MLNIFNEANINQVKVMPRELTKEVSLAVAKEHANAADAFVDKFIPDPVSCLRVEAARCILEGARKATFARLSVLRNEIDALKKFGAGVGDAIKLRQKEIEALQHDGDALHDIENVLENWQLQHDAAKEDNELI